MKLLITLITTYKIFLYMGVAIAIGVGLAALWLIFNLRKEKYLAEQVGDLIEHQEFRRYRYTGPAFILVVAVFSAAFIYGADFSAKPTFCANCHEMKPFYKSWQTSTHKNVNCLMCHQEPGSLGFIIAKAEGLRNYSLRSLYFGRFRPPLAFISNKACLQCHQDLITKVLTSNNIRVSHKEFVNVFNCADCHPQVGHKYVSQKTAVPVMNRCLFCHRQPDEKASSRCSSCHLKDIGYKPGQIDNYQLVDFSAEACKACH